MTMTLLDLGIIMAIYGLALIIASWKGHVRLGLARVVTWLDEQRLAEHV